MEEKLFNKKLITFNATATNWEEAINISCKKLLEYKYITKDYIQSIYEVINDMGPYFILLDNFALPHANNFGAVFKSGISLTILKQPVEFSNGKRVQVLCTLAAKDNNQHLELLKELTKILEKPNIIDKLMKVKDLKKLEKILEEK